MLQNRSVTKFGSDRFHSPKNTFHGRCTGGDEVLVITGDITYKNLTPILFETTRSDSKNCPSSATHVWERR